MDQIMFYTPYIHVKEARQYDKSKTEVIIKRQKIQYMGNDFMLIYPPLQNRF
jgi:hypothetical protein